MNRMDPISTSMEEVASELESPTGTTLRSAASDEEAYNTVSSAPPKRRAGRTKFRETRHPVYKGVRWRNGGKWVCEVREPNKKSRIWLGTFPTAEMAARAHDVAAMALRGRGACLNFADSARLLPALPASATPREIQRAAAEAVEAFRPLAAAAEEGGDQPEDAAAAPPPPPPGDVEAGGADGGFPEAALQGYMASASMLSPPHHGIQMPHWGGNYWDDVEDEYHVPLWSYSI